MLSPPNRHKKSPPAWKQLGGFSVRQVALCASPGQAQRQHLKSSGGPPTADTGHHIIQGTFNLPEFFAYNFRIASAEWKMQIIQWRVIVTFKRLTMRVPPACFPTFSFLSIRFFAHLCISRCVFRKQKDLQRLYLCNYSVRLGAKRQSYRYFAEQEYSGVISAVLLGNWKHHVPARGGRRSICCTLALRLWWWRGHHQIDGSTIISTHFH